MTIEIHEETPVGELASLHPSTIRVFQRHGIDFCCGGKTPLHAAGAEHGVPFETLRDELRSAAAGPAPEERSLSEAGEADVIRHILGRYHRTLRQELPRLAGMLEKVVRAHGSRHPELVEGMTETFRALRAELEPHMLKEEDLVFPQLLRLEALSAAGRLIDAPREPLEEAVRALVAEHEGVGALLRRLREVTRDFAPPEGACNTYRGLLHGLAEMEGELHQHIHLENNVLFPKAAKRLGGVAAEACASR